MVFLVYTFFYHRLSPRIAIRLVGLPMVFPSRAHPFSTGRPGWHTVSGSASVGCRAGCAFHIKEDSGPILCLVLYSMMVC